MSTSFHYAVSNVHFHSALNVLVRFIGSAWCIRVSCISRCVPRSRASDRLTSELNQRSRCRTRRTLLRRAVFLCRSPRAPRGNPPEVGTCLALRRIGNSDQFMAAIAAAPCPGRCFNVAVYVESVCCERGLASLLRPAPALGAFSCHRRARRPIRGARLRTELDRSRPDRGDCDGRRYVHAADGDGLR